MAAGMSGLLILAAVAAARRSQYALDALTCFTGLLVLYPFRKRLFFSVPGVVLCIASMYMDSVGLFGAFEWTFLGIGWDKLAHLTSAAGLTLLIFEYLRRRRLTRFECFNITFLLVNGFNALEEIWEFVGSVGFGVHQGMYSMMNGLTPRVSTFERYDTQWDLIFNCIGAAVTLSVIWMVGPRAHD
jgi:hypothetical protein